MPLAPGTASSGQQLVELRVPARGLHHRAGGGVRRIERPGRRIDRQIVEEPLPTRREPERADGSPVGEREAEDAGHGPGNVPPGPEARRARDAAAAPGQHPPSSRRGSRVPRRARGPAGGGRRSGPSRRCAGWPRFPRRPVGCGGRRPCPRGRGQARGRRSRAGWRAPGDCVRGCPAPAHRARGRRAGRRSPGSSRDRARPTSGRRRRGSGASARDHRARPWPMACSKRSTGSPGLCARAFSSRSSSGRTESSGAAVQPGTPASTCARTAPATRVETSHGEQDPHPASAAGPRRAGEGKCSHAVARCSPRTRSPPVSGAQPPRDAAGGGGAAGVSRTWSGSPVGRPTPRMDASRISTGWAAAGPRPGPEQPLDLQRAAGVRGGSSSGRRAQARGHLALADLVRALRLDEVVDAGAAAALLAIRNVHHLQPGDAPQESARLAADALAVREVTGVVVGDARRDRMTRRPRRAERHQELGARR